MNCRIISKSFLNFIISSRTTTQRHRGLTGASAPEALDLAARRGPRPRHSRFTQERRTSITRHPQLRSPIAPILHQTI